MATATEEHAADHTAVGDEHEHHHPSDKTYWAVGGALGLVTALEVSTYFITDDPYNHEWGGAIIASLLVMMTIKFAVIGMWFMHLKFDNRIFRRLFVSGLVLALVVYGIVFFAFEYWYQGYEAVEEGMRALS